MNLFKPEMFGPEKTFNSINAAETANRILEGFLKGCVTVYGRGQYYPTWYIAPIPGVTHQAVLVGVREIGEMTTEELLKPETLQAKLDEAKSHLNICKEALESISSIHCAEDGKHCDSKWWVENSTVEKMAETLANDTNIAREALSRIGDGEKR